MKFWRLPKWLRIIFGALALLIMAESIVRACGVLNFPLYQADAHVGYWPAAEQSGSFLNRNRWYFNERGMGVAEAFLPDDDRRDVLLVGDSIVLGGNPLDQLERLGLRLTQLTGARHWPVSAGSWALLNELRFLKRNMDVVDQADAITFVLNSADFGQASSWACEITHPRERPGLALAHVVRKYLLVAQLCTSDPPAELKVPAADWRVEWRELMADARMRGKPVEVWLYPTQEEALHPELLSARLESVGKQLRMEGLSASLVLRSLGRDSRWSQMTYADAIHPDAAGVGIMSKIMAAPSSDTLVP